MELVQEIGAAAGVASVVGLAVLSALYVSHARDVKRLREWAGRAPERSGRGGAAMPGPPPRSRRRGTRHVAVALVGVFILGGAATCGVPELIGDDGGDHPGNAQGDRDNASRHKPKRTGALVKPGNVTVAILNGTTVPGLAAALSDRITAAGFQKGPINTFPDQQRAESVVQYAPGHEAAAIAVGRIFGIRRREPVTADTGALAGSATVIVIAGADKASAAGGA